MIFEDRCSNSDNVKIHYLESASNKKNLPYGHIVGMADSGHELWEFDFNKFAKVLIVFLEGFDKPAELNP